MGEAVKGGVSHRGAEHFAKRRGTKTRVVVDVATGRTALPDTSVGVLVELEQVHPRSCHLDKLCQDACDKSASRADLVDLGAGEAGRLSPH